MDSLSTPTVLDSGKAGPVLPDWSGKTLGEFQLLRRLGQGGMGQVYLAEQLSLKRKVAIKIMRPDVAAQETNFQRFRAEAESLAQITHANIVQVFAFGQEQGVHYIALEYVEGRNLREYLARKGTTDLPLALSIMRQVASALQRAGELGIIHRDIKPDNILLTRRGEVKVADFGLARFFGGENRAPNLTQSGLTLGTPLYMSPEQIQGQALDQRTDIYSFGITCYHMLSGSPPFQGQNTFDLALQHVQMEARALSEIRPDLPVELCAVVHKMMAKDKAARYQTCAELLSDLAGLRERHSRSRADVTLDSLPLLSIGAPSTDNGKGKVDHASRWRLAAMLGSLLLAGLLGAGWAWHKNGATNNLDVTDADSYVTEEDQARHEQFLLSATEQYAQPDSRAELELGVGHLAELIHFYLKHRRFEDVNRLAEKLLSDLNEVKPYRVLGRIGKAIVLAHQDRAAQSNQIFLELDRPRLQGETRPEPFWLHLWQLRYDIGIALDRNKVNATPQEPFPAELEFLREPPRPVAKRQ